MCTVCRYNFPQSSRCDVCGEWAFQIAAQRRRETRTKHTSNESCWEQCSCTLWIVTWLQSNITCIMWLKLTWNIFFLLCLSPLNMSLFPAEPRCPKFEVNQINTYVLHSIGNSPSDLKPVEWELGTRTLCSTYTHGHTHLKHEKINYEVDWSSHKCYILQPQTEASGVRAGHTYFSVVKPAL